MLASIPTRKIRRCSKPSTPHIAAVLPKFVVLRQRVMDEVHGSVVWIRSRQSSSAAMVPGKLAVTGMNSPRSRVSHCREAKGSALTMHNPIPTHVLVHGFRSRMYGVLALIGLIMACSSSRVHAKDETPGQLVLSNTERVIHALSDRRAEFQSNPAALHQFIHAEFTQLFDRTYSARLVLGLDSRAASDVEMRAFVDALGDDLLNRYGNSLLKVHPGLNVRVVSETPLRNGTIIKVACLIDRRAGPPVEVDYLLHQNAGRWQAFDVIVEGISFVQTFRAMFVDELRSKSLAQITEELRDDRIQVKTAIPHRPSGKQ